MARCSSDYSAHYRWKWFNREHWRRSFREQKRRSSGAFIELMRERGMENQPVLDCSCGLGLKTIVMREAGLAVSGADACPEAVRLARRFAEEEGHEDIPYFVSSWADLPRNAEIRYAAIFNDALSWVYEDKEMAASLRGLHDSLLPGGILAYMGALPGTQDDRQQLLDQEWEKRTASGRHRPGIAAVDGRTSVQEVLFLEKGTDYIEEHHLYAVREGDEQRIETCCVRVALKWDWATIQPLLEEVGFISFTPKEFVAASDEPFPLVVAVRD